MKKMLMFVLLAVTSLAFAQSNGYEATPLTKLTVMTAANFTDGFIVPCAPELMQEGSDNVCVDTSDTSWSVSDLRQFSTYGFSDWLVINSWERTTLDNGVQYYSAIVANVSTREMVFIIVLSPEAANVVGYDVMYIIKYVSE